jgi:hypothetical protein
MVRFDPIRADFSPYGFSCVRWTPTTMSRCDRHNEIELNLLEGGRLVYLMGGQKPAVPAGRLSHAQRLLVTTEDLILRIALSSGFGSLSRFNEAFRQAFGCTPREYRGLHRLE